MERCKAKTAGGKRCKRSAGEDGRCHLHPKQTAGRPPIEWTKKQWKQFDGWCKVGAALQDIADGMGHKFETIEAIVARKHGMEFSEYRDAKRAGTRCLLAEQQLKVAMKGDRTMLIWLGKQWLGQTDRNEVEAIVRISHEEALSQLDPDEDSGDGI
jgi:hypothetical protein